MRVMAAKAAAATSHVAALVLGAITLFVFYTLRDYGPESAVRRFHDDLVTGNTDDLRDVTYGGQLDSPAVSDLARVLKTLDRAGAGSQIADVDLSRTGVASVLVAYRTRQKPFFVVWVVRLNSIHSWQVDANATIQALMTMIRRQESYAP